MAETHRFTIPGRLPGMNEIIAAAKSHYGQYSAQKAENTALVAACAKGLPKLNAAHIRICWFEPDERRDVDNVASGAKYVLDGIVRAGVLPNDTRKHVLSLTNEVMTDRKSPRIEVELIAAD